MCRALVASVSAAEQTGRRSCRWLGRRPPVHRDLTVPRRDNRNGNGVSIVSGSHTLLLASGSEHREIPIRGETRRNRQITHTPVTH